MQKEKKSLPSLLYIFLGIVLGITIKLFVFDIVKVSGPSMENTIHSESLVVIGKLAYGMAVPFGDSLFLQWNKPEKNDIIIYVQDEKIVVKRCIATENDPLEISGEKDYNLTAGGKKISLTESQYKNLSGIERVPQDCIMAVGDNYSQSIDSRDYGFIPSRNVLGKVLWK